MTQIRTRRKSRWRTLGRRMLAPLLGAVGGVALMLGLLLLPESTARWSLVAMSFVGSTIAGFGLGVPVRRWEKHRLSLRGRMANVYAPVFGFYATACGVAGLSALDQETWSGRATLAFLVGSVVGLLFAFLVKPEPGTREALDGAEPGASAA